MKSLAYLVDDSFTNGNIPDKFKLGRIAITFQQDSRFDKGNYKGQFLFFRI